MSQQMDEVMIYKDPVSLLQRLIRFNTTNPPGNEVDCIIYIKGLLEGAGIETKMMGMDAKRQNLVARIKGEGNSPPFLMYGHVDVVSVENQKWTNPPFDGVIKDGNIWGRGALDMKGAVAMMICAFIRAKVEGASLPGDILLCIVCDEENDGTYGAKYLVEEYGDMFKEVRYAIGEIGGFTLHMDNKKFYPIMVAEKQLCRLRTVIKGPGGHGSMPIHGGSMAKLGYVLSKAND
jgi:acetylornithine deacetylase/succinyl-diaminopimelate desuccinylase-like protein